MNSLLNTAQKFVLVRDLSQLINFDLLTSEFDKLEFESNYLNKISKEKYFFDRQDLSGIKSLFENECKEYLDFGIGIKNLYDGLKITNSWGNITYSEESHHEHIHPFSIVSGVVFLDDNVNNLLLTVQGYVPEIPHFIPNRLIHLKLHDLVAQIGVSPKEHNNLKNHVVLFLSNCPHYVQQTPKNSSPRRTISFNTFWKGEVGKSSPDLGTMIF